MKKLVLRLSAAAIAAAGTQAYAQSVTIDQQDIKAKRICGSEMGENGCRTTKFGLTLSENDIPLTLTGSTPNYLNVLGRTVRRGDTTGTLNALRPCSLNGLQAFKPTQIDAIPDDRDFNYERKADLVKYADLGLDLKQLMRTANVPASKLDKLEASFKSKYNKTAGRKYTMRGRFVIVSLPVTLVDQVKSTAGTDPAAVTCGNYLRAQRNAGAERNLISSISIVDLEEGSYIGGIVSELAADFAAKVQAEAPGADVATLKAGISSKVTTNLTVNIGREVRVIAWDYSSLPTD